jgi:hypothetical protein
MEMNEFFRRLVENERDILRLAVGGTQNDLSQNERNRRQESVDSQAAREVRS